MMVPTVGLSDQLEAGSGFAPLEPAGPGTLPGGGVTVTVLSGNTGGDQWRIWEPPQPTADVELYGQSITLPDAKYVHLFLALGAADLEGAGVLTGGDAVRIVDSAGQRLTAVGPAEVLVWEMNADLRRPLSPPAVPPGLAHAAARSWALFEQRRGLRLAKRSG